MNNLIIEYTLEYQIPGKPGSSFEVITIRPDYIAMKKAKQIVKRNGAEMVKIDRMRMHEENEKILAGRKRQ